MGEKMSFITSEMLKRFLEQDTQEAIMQQVDRMPQFNIGEISDYERVPQGHPAIVDCFYHEEVRGTANSGKRNRKTD